ncbi:MULTISPECIES: hypothetical protein [unclassified Streptomyces]|uniref:hypothetical protein n=1 Tax=unclassified Streptomyces TaxID=2593676 RepID=UPI00343747BE
MWTAPTRRPICAGSARRRVGPYPAQVVYDARAAAVAAELAPVRAAPARRVIRDFAG